ncbi:MAG TPA: hypothetical protein VF212_15500 [Longimicrobiales bacterium]
MFEQWKKAWRDAVASFWQELDDTDGAAAPERLAAMRRDARAARAELERVTAELERARGQLAEEREAEQRCRRRESLARGIGDEETARVAAEFAARHAERTGVLARKVDAIEAELALRRRDVEEMESALRAVEAAGAAVGGAAGAAGGGGSGGAPNAGGAGEPLTEADAARDREFRRMEREAREEEAERRLEELKRRMR